MENSINTTADLFKALSDSTRLKILKIIAGTGNKLCVGMIAHKLDISQPAVSQHLKILKNVGLVKADREGFHVHYMILNDSLSVLGVDTFSFLKSFGAEMDLEAKCNPVKNKDICEH